MEDLIIIKYLPVGDIIWDRGIENLNSIENLLSKKSYEGINLEATLASKFASEFYERGTKIILKASK
jgi:hypothetical protein